MYILPLVGTTVAKGLCIGAFDLKGFLDAFTVGFLFFFACWAVTATSDLVLDLAAKRLDQTLPPVKESLHTIQCRYRNCVCPELLRDFCRKRSGTF